MSKYIINAWVRALLVISISNSLIYISFAQQKTDTTFQIPDFKDPHFLNGQGPRVFIDETHHNFHTATSGFYPFTQLIQKDGYRPDSWEDKKLPPSPSVLVIVNALNEKNLEDWTRPVYPAFQAETVHAINQWVKQGGWLLLIADHMPFAGAAASLAKSFGIEFVDGFAFMNEKEEQLDVFSMENGRLNPNLSTQRIASFTGSAFKLPQNAINLMSFNELDSAILPETAWEFEKNIKVKNIQNYSQGGIFSYGKGRVAVFGEAAMFTAQSIEISGHTFYVGFNSPKIKTNIDFIREVMKLLTDDKAFESFKAKHEIYYTNREMERRFMQGDIENTTMIYAVDAIMVGPGVEENGRKAITDYWYLFEGVSMVNWQLTMDDFRLLNQNYALQRGLSIMTYKDGADTLSSISKFSLLWQKRHDDWKILLDHFSPPPK